MGTRQRLGRCLHSAASRLQAIGGFWYRDRQRRTSEKLSGVEVSGLTEMECCSVPGDEAGAWPARVGHECSEVIGQVRIDRHSDHAIGIRTSNRSPMHSLPPGWWAQTNSPAVVSGSPESSGDLDHHRVQRRGLADHEGCYFGEVRGESYEVLRQVQLVVTNLQPRARPRGIRIGDECQQLVLLVRIKRQPSYST